MELNTRSISIRVLVSGVIAFGVITIGMVVYSQWLTSRNFEENAGLVRLTQTIQQEIATAHLWFEEALGGDASIDIQVDVHVPVRSALALVEIRLNGGEADGVRIDPSPPEVRENLEALRDDIALLDNLVDERWSGRDSTGVIGGAEDQAFDDVFRDILLQSSKIAEQVDNSIARDQRSIFAISGGMLIALLVLFSALTVLIVWNRRELDARASQLEHLVKVRTASLAAREAEARQRNEELKLARDQAHAASEAKSQFLANMSHEIRTPMNGVVGMASLLMRTSLSTLQKEYVNTMHHSGLSLLKIINEVLDFSKIEAGKVTLDAESFSLQATLEDSLHLFSAEAARKGLVLTSSVEADVPAILSGDSVRLGQVFSNLISNAIKFSEQGEISVACRMVESSADRGSRFALAFEVTDPGIGIAEEHQDKLFEQFSQVDASSTRQHGGTGLGLAICKEIVILMGGRIGLRSKPGEGCTIWFTAEFEEGVESSIAPDPFESSDRKFANYSVTGEGRRRWSHVEQKVLVVDDNEVNLLVARRMLEELGFEVDLAANGQEAIDAAAAYAYAAILIDSQMPGMDGNEATSIIRKAQGTDGYTPIIALTANVMATDRASAFAAGVDDYLSKPVFLEDLLASLERLLDGTGDGPPRIVSADLRPTDISTFPIFDSGMVDELRSISRSGDSDLFTELADQFLKQMPGWLGEIRQSAEDGDSEALARHAHKLLGLCRQIGAQRMAQICDDLESMGSAGAGQDALQGVAMLRDEFESADRVLRSRFLP